MIKKIFAFILLCSLSLSVKAQVSYFPPLVGTTWDTMSPQTLGWCQPKIDSLYTYLQNKNSKAFIVLKNGKIVLEKYFGTFTADSAHIWNSASKSLTSMLTGIAQEKGFININNPVSQYVGTGWTSETSTKEALIKVKNLLCMTSGLKPGTGCSDLDSSAACLQYLVDAGNRWAYHTGAYYHVEQAVSMASGMTYNNFTSTYLSNHIGMTGLWYNNIYYSKARSAARFGLLTLNNGIWNTDTILHDTAYFHTMKNTSQTFNLSYGYLWWLNGKASYLGPGVITPYTGALVPNAPADMFCALGKDDQKIYVIPSQNMVIVRMGNSAGDTSSQAFSPFDNELWGKIDSLGMCSNAGIYKNAAMENDFQLYPNPGKDYITIKLTRLLTDKKLLITNVIGEIVYSAEVESSALNYTLDVSLFPKGIYFVAMNNSVKKLVIE